MSDYWWRKEVICGVYRIRHKRTGAAYVGGSVNVLRRYVHHQCVLRNGMHKCTALQEAWDRYGENAFAFELLRKCKRDRLRELEDQCAKKEKRLLNTRLNRGFKLSEETLRIMSKNAIRQAADPDERVRRSERAKQQHRDGNFGIRI